MNSVHLEGTKKPVNVLIMEKEPEIQSLYKKFFNIVKSRVSFTIVSDIHHIVTIPSDKYTNDQGDRSSDNHDKGYTINLNDQSIFDVIIIDVNVGNFEGIEIAKQILKKMPRQKIIFTTTLDSDSIKKKMDKEEIFSSTTILQKPFRFSDLLSILTPSKGRFDNVNLCDHILVTYNTLQEELMDVAEFINRGIELDELNLLLIRSDMSLERTSTLLKSVGLSNLDDILNSKSLLILKNEDWYIPDGRVDKYRIINQWHDLVNKSIQSGKNGLRAFCMMDCFFETGFSKEVVDYESTLPSKFQIPFVPVCAYRQNDFNLLSESEKQRMIESHNHMIMT